MANASDIHGVVFHNGSVTLLARVVGAQGTAVNQASIASIAYTVTLLDESDPTVESPVTGHTDVALVVADAVYDALQTDVLWDVDSTGYNFRHTLDVSADQAFTIAGRVYRVVFRLTPTSGQVILVRFRVHAI